MYHKKVTSLLSIIRILMYHCDEFILDLVKKIIDSLLLGHPELPDGA